MFFFFNDTATTEIYTLSLHDALPISMVATGKRRNSRSGHVLTPCPPLRVAERGDEPKRRCAILRISGANTRWSTTAASIVPAVATSVVAHTPSRGPYQMMAGSCGTTARAMLDRNA